MDQWIEERQEGVLLRVKVTPRAHKDQVLPPRDAFLPVKIKAPPVESKANKSLLALIAKTLGVRGSAVTLVSGHRSRAKTILISDASLGEVNKALSP